MSSRRKKRPPHVPWWWHWPQLRWYVSIDTVTVLRYQRWGGIELVAWCPRWMSNAANYPPLPDEMMRDFRMKRPEQNGPRLAVRAAPHEELAALYPLLADHLTALQYDDEPPVPRETSTLTIFAADGSFRVCLRDRAEKRCLWAASATWSELLLVLEMALSDPVAIWREDRLSGADTAKRIPPTRKPT